MIPAAAPGGGLLERLVAAPPRERDRLVEAHLGIGGEPPSSAQPGRDLTGYHPSGISPIVRALRDAPVGADDVVVDVGSGLGKVVLVAHLLTGARARGVELQPSLVERAREAARRLVASVTFSAEDARDADLSDGTVFFLYAPCTGQPFLDVLARLRAAAERRAIVVCTLGIDVPREATWLVPRASDAFWLTVYDSAVPGVPPRERRWPVLAGEAVDAIAEDRVTR